MTAEGKMFAAPDPTLRFMIVVAVAAPPVRVAAEALAVPPQMSAFVVRAK